MCNQCVGAIQNKELLVLHTQLPLPKKKWGINKGVYVTAPYLVDTMIAPYTGRTITSVIEATVSSSDFIVSLFEEGTPLDDQTFVDGDCVAMYINHPVVGAFKVNCHVRLRGTQDNTRIEVWALRDIIPGEELFFDYGDTYFQGKTRNKKEIKALTRQDVRRDFAKVYDAQPGMLKTNLRDGSGINPSLDQWVKKAKKIIEDRYAEKARKKREGTTEEPRKRKKERKDEAHKTHKRKKK